MDFAYPQFAWLALALPALAALLYIGQKLRQEAKLGYAKEELITRFGKSKNADAWSWIYPVGTFATCVLLWIASMGPMINATPRRVPDGSVQAVVVLDVSKSMAAEDYREHMPADAGEKPDLNEAWGSRLEMAKYQILKLMKELQGNQLGIVNYAEKGFAQADLTSDFTALDFVVRKWVELGNAPGTGSHYDKGLAEAIKTFQREGENPSKKKVIVLMSDGGFDGNPEELAKVVEELKIKSIKLVIVGFGIPGQNAIPVYEGGKLTGYMQVDGKPVSTSYEEDNLRKLAGETGGTYHHVDLSPAGQSLSLKLSSELGGYRTELKGTPLFLYFAGAALALTVLLSIAGFLQSRSR